MSNNIPVLIAQMIETLSNSSEPTFAKDNVARSLETIRDKIDIALKRYKKK